MKTKSSHYIINTEESERIKVLKIWLTIMIIFIHSYTEKVVFTEESVVMQVPIWLYWIKFFVSRIISQCAVPGFFFISAVLLYKKNFTWMENIKKKLKTLLVPYLIFNTLWIIICFIAQNITFLRPYFSQEANIISNWGILEYADAYLGFASKRVMLYPLWFIRDLLVLNILAIIIKKLIDKFPKIIFMLLSIMVALNVKTHLFFLRQDALIFFCLGYYFVKYSIKFNDIDKIKAPYIIIAYIVVIFLDFWARDTSISHLPHFASIIIGFIFFYRFTTKITNKKIHNIIMKISKYSFSIYLFHEMNLTILKKLLTKLLPQTALWQTALYFGIPIIIFSLCLLLSIILDKYFHKIYLILVGSRSM